MATIKEYEEKYGKIMAKNVFAVTEDGVVFETANGRFVEGCVGEDNKHDGIVRVSSYYESWSKWLDLALYIPSAKPEWATQERIEEAKKSIESPLFIGDFQFGAYGNDPYEK